MSLMVQLLDTGTVWRRGGLSGRGATAAGSCRLRVVSLQLLLRL